jgi:hypothetical protein
MPLSIIVSVALVVLLIVTVDLRIKLNISRNKVAELREDLSEANLTVVELNNTVGTLTDVNMQLTTDLRLKTPNILHG